MQSERASVLAAAIAASALFASDADAARCLFVSSYHQGYAWSDGVERGLRSVLEGRCELRQFDMDTKRRKSDVDKREAAEAARRLIESWQPDVVITADARAVLIDRPVRITSTLISQSTPGEPGRR